MELKDYFIFLYHFCNLYDYIYKIGYSSIDDRDSMLWHQLQKVFPKDITVDSKKCDISLADNLFGKCLLINIPEDVFILDSMNPAGRFYIERITIYRTMMSGVQYNSICFTSNNKYNNTTSMMLNRANMLMILRRSYAINALKVQDAIDSLPEEYSSILAALYMEIKLKGSGDIV
ncbi:MAG TPA: hypothetical protein VK190_02505 [Pseudoneobacillus sp.]|nr:hypothetical protein [Pseudoneobacillus sp.]